MTSVWDFVNSISYNKKDLMTGTENDELQEKTYVPFVVNRALSYFPDTVLYSNQINMYASLDNKLQYEYLLNSIRPKKRFSKWAKKQNDEDLLCIREYYKVSLPVAEAIKKILTPEQIQELRLRMDAGGIK